MRKQKKNVQFATRLRGFFKQLITSNRIEFIVEESNNKIYETNSKLYNIKVKLVRSKLANLLGLIQRIKIQANPGIDVVGSFNRFLNSSKPYFIYVENPTALYHYTLGRVKTYLGKRHIKEYLGDPNLRALIFMSKSCETTFDKLVGSAGERVIKKQIYPLVKQNPLVSRNLIMDKRYSKDVKFVYISQGIRFKSKGGLEIISAFKHLYNNYPNITLTVVTNLEMLDRKILQDIGQCSGITLKDFKLSYHQMQELYAESDVLLQPTSDDSCSLTILEALHSGLAFVTSSLYSIPEIVEDEVNGYLVEPHYWFFSKDSNLPNPEVWNHRSKTIYSGKVSPRLINDLVERMEILINKPEKLTMMRLNSWNKANNPPFSEEYIAKQWNDLVIKISEG